MIVVALLTLAWSLPLIGFAVLVAHFVLEDRRLAPMGDAPAPGTHPSPVSRAGATPTTNENRPGGRACS